MIPADCSIDDEVPLFPVNLNGKRLQRYEQASDTHIHKTIAVIHLLEKRKSQEWDPKIAGSGHLADKTVVTRRSVR